MKSETRIIKASILTGFSEMLIGLLMALTSWHEWYYSHFHFFGILGMGMALYGFWHYIFYRIEIGKTLWGKRK